jgi:hypothetical protein
MRGTWWRWLSAVLAAICGLVFGWIAGADLARAAPAVDAGADAAQAAPAGRRAGDQPRWAPSQSSARFQPSSASALR